MVAGGPFGAAVRTATASIQSGQRVSFAKKRTNAIKEMNNRDVPCEIPRQSCTLKPRVSICVRTVSMM